MRLYISGETKDGKKYKIQNEKLEEKVIEKERLREFIRQGKVEVVNYRTWMSDNVLLDRKFMTQIYKKIDEGKVSIIIKRLPWTSNFEAKRSKLRMLGNIIAEKDGLIAYYSDKETVNIESNKRIMLDNCGPDIGLFSCLIECDVTSIILNHLGLDGIDTSKVTDMRWMFGGTSIENLDISSFDTSKVTDMSGMFWRAEIKNLDLSSFDTSKVTKMSSMFEQVKIENLDLSSFDTSKVTNMGEMFARAYI